VGLRATCVACVACVACVVRVVFDTNVLLSLWVFDKRPGGSRLAALRVAVERGDLVALSRDDCLAEFQRVLGYPEFGLSAAMQQEALDDYLRVLQLPSDGVEDAAAEPFLLPRCSDRDDQKFLELARDGAAQLLVTSDKALLRLARRKTLAGRFRIITPEQLLAELPQPHSTIAGENTVGSPSARR
jgi:putative PIN family toxin of toxin-antitoxin system